VTAARILSWMLAATMLVQVATLVLVALIDAHLDCVGEAVKRIAAPRP
jgi:hypothetical protein